MIKYLVGHKHYDPYNETPTSFWDVFLIEANTEEEAINLYEHKINRPAWRDISTSILGIIDEAGALDIIAQETFTLF